MMEIILMIDFFLFSFYDQIKFEKKRHYLLYNLIILVLKFTQCPSVSSSYQNLYNNIFYNKYQIFQLCQHLQMTAAYL